MMIRSASVSYTRDEGTMLPGYTLDPVIFGLNPSNSYAPGLDFVLGDQFAMAERAARNSAPWASNPWLTPNSQQPNRHAITYKENLNFRSTVEPFKDFRIDVTATKVYGFNENSLYRRDDEFDPGDSKYFDETQGYINGYKHFNRMVQGNYSISFWSLGSAFETSNARDNYQSDVYDEFLANRLVISERLAFQDQGLDTNFNPYPDSTNYGYDGYSVYAQDVLLPAFLAAYGGYDVNKVTLTAQPTFPIPNWKINYNGLMKIESFRKKFNTFTVSHGYRSLYTISNFQTNLQRQQRIDDDLPGDDLRNENGDFLPQYQIGQVTMTEAFRPLIGVNMRMKNNTTLKIEINKDRNIGLSLANNQLTETKGSEIVVGAGYIIKDVKFNFIRTGASKKAVVSNLELRGDVSVRDNQTVIRRILENINQVTAGQRIVTIKVFADYQLSRRVSARIFYDQIISTFKTSNAFPTNNVHAGFSFRLNLAQ